MLNKNDLIVLLTELQDNGIECKKQLQQVFSTDGIPMDVLKFINENRPIESYLFYEKIRKSHNDKKSALYSNLVKEDIGAQDVIVCLASLQLQILLYSKQVEDKTMFLRQMRFDEICKVLLNYYKTSDFIPCVKLKNLFKADIKAFEYIKE